MPNAQPTKSSTFCWKRALLRNGRTLGTCTRSRSADSCVPSSKARSSAFKLASQPVVKVFCPRTLWFQIWRQTESWKHSAAVGARQVPVSALTCPPLRKAASLASGLTRIDSGLSTIVWIPACIFSDNFIFFRFVVDVRDDLHVLEEGFVLFWELLLCLVKEASGFLEFLLRLVDSVF